MVEDIESLRGNRVFRGHQRRTCSCLRCRAGCKARPGHLLPDDLVALKPKGEDLFKWGEEHLMASAGCLVESSAHSVVTRVGTLTPKTEGRFRCHWLDENENCMVHGDSPFGCAFYTNHPRENQESLRTCTVEGLKLLCAEAEKDQSDYQDLWYHLWKEGQTATPSWWGGRITEALITLQMDKEYLDEGTGCLNAEMSVSQALDLVTLDKKAEEIEDVCQIALRKIVPFEIQEVYAATLKPAKGNTWPDFMTKVRVA